MRSERGFALLLVFVFMLVLSVLVGVLLFIVNYETIDINAGLIDSRLLNLAEAGLDKAMCEIRKDAGSISQTGRAHLRGADTAGSENIKDISRICYIGEPNGAVTISDNSAIAQIQGFDANYAGARIISVELGVIAKSNGGGAGTAVAVSYTTKGIFPESANTVLIQTLTTTMGEYFKDITIDRAWSWEAIMSPGFIVRAQRSSGDRDISLDALCLRVAYEIDTNTEPWAVGNYAVFPINLGSGTIQVVSIIAEQGKVHLNTASRALLRYLMVEHGINEATADILVGNIINYRVTKNFDTIAEIKQVVGMTKDIYDTIKQDITVYSFINIYNQRPQEARAPVNINTASREVLKAIFDPLDLEAGDSEKLALDIISQRTNNPFTCFYSFDSAVTTDFYDFIKSRPYLGRSHEPDEQDRVLDNADASKLIPVAGSSLYDALTTGFCYSTNTFKVESLSETQGRRFCINTILGHDGEHTFTTFLTDTISVGYRREEFR